MKIKTLTTYDVYNYGASLQAYALQSYLTQQGHEVEIINFQPEYLTRKYDYRWVNPESKASKYTITRCVYRIAKYLQRQTTMGRKRQFDEFNHGVLRETKEIYRSYEELCANPPVADLYVVGSDQIWNVLYEAGRDPAFYLDFVRKGRKASYAASFSYLDIDAENMAHIKSSLESFTAVSVRESHGMDILRKMGIKGEWVLDPVFLLSIDEWKQQMTVFQKTHPYLLIYDFESNEALKEFSLAYAKVHGLKVYAIVDTYPLRYADRNFKSAGPKDFLTLIYHCDALVSNSFHGTAFSIMFNKPVFVFSRHRHKVNSRMESLLSLFFGEAKCDAIFDANHDYDAEFKWKHVNNILEVNQKSSKAFLKGLSD